MFTSVKKILMYNCAARLFFMFDFFMTCFDFQKTNKNNIWLYSYAPLYNFTDN